MTTFSVLLAVALSLPEAARPALSGADYLAKLVEQAGSKNLWQDRYWRLLLHYRKGITGTYSEVKSGPFFLSPLGRKDPRAELEATLRAFFAPVPEDPAEHAQCRFPARYAWLRERLGFDAGRLPEQDCAFHRTWRESVDAGSLSLVYASAYMNSPASMYGHTFLLLERKAGRGERLLDHAVNFAADVTTSNGILFAVYGLVGIFPGRFSVLPYYVKVQEYSNFESRDLWEYRLNLEPAEVERLLRHLFELEKARFPYYFFNKNCSYQLLPLLEVARPELHLTDHWPFYVVPADTVRSVIGRPGLLAEESYRPSQVTRMLSRRRRLGDSEVRLAERLAREPGDAALAELRALPEGRRPLVLGSAADYLEFRIDYRRVDDRAVLERQRQLNLELGRLGAGPAPADDPPPPPPEAGHDTARLGLAFGPGESPFVELSLRFALHDVLDRDAGYNRDSTLEMGHLRLRRDAESHEVYLSGLDLVRIVSLAPRDRWVKKASWALRAGFDLAAELGEPAWKSRYFGLTLGKGLAFQTGLGRRAVWYSLLELDGGLGGVFQKDYRVGGGGTAGLLLEVAPWWRTRLEASYRAYAAGDDRSSRRLSLETAISPAKDLALRFRFEKRGSQQEALVSLQTFF